MSGDGWKQMPGAAEDLRRMRPAREAALGSGVAEDDAAGRDLALSLPPAEDGVSLLTARELAEAIGLKPATVLDKWERGEFPGYRFGRAVRFSLDEILALGRRGPGAGGGAPAPPDGNPARGVVSVLPAPHNRGGDDA